MMDRTLDPPDSLRSFGCSDRGYKGSLCYHSSAPLVFPRTGPHLVRGLSFALLRLNFRYLLDQRLTFLLTVSGLLVNLNTHPLQEDLLEIPLKGVH